MESKHDLLTAGITVLFLALLGILGYTHQLTGTIQTLGFSGLSSVLAYWFARGGSIMGTTPANGNAAQPQFPTATIEQLISTAVQNELNNIAKTPAQPKAGAAVETPSTGQN